MSVFLSERPAAHLLLTGQKHLPWPQAEADRQNISALYFNSSQFKMLKLKVDFEMGQLTSFCFSSLSTEVFIARVTSLPHLVCKCKTVPAMGVGNVSQGQPEEKSHVEKVSVLPEQCEFAEHTH